MMKKLKQIGNSIGAFVLLLPLALPAQQAGMTIVGLSGQNMTVTGSALYLPAGAYLNHTGNIYVAVNQIVAGNAGTVITGAPGSRLHLLGASQLDATAPATATQLDANGVAIDVDVTLYNGQNLSLTDQAFGAVSANGAADATVLREFAFGVTHPFTGVAVTDNHLLTNSNRFIVGASGSLTGYDVNRYVVTNTNAGELRKLGLINGQAFFFPIGRAEADYTPARMQVASGGPVDYYMNVRNFAESIPDENIGGYATSPNVSRTWMIYGSNAGSVANMDFIHPGTPMYEVNGYNRNNSNVIRFGGNGWIPNQPNDAENQSLFGTPANYWAQQIAFAVPAAMGANSFYGKSNSLIALPVRLGDFTVTAPRCEAVINWTTLAEENLSRFVIERSFTGAANSWEVVSTRSAAGNSATVRQYSVTDFNPNSGGAFYRLAIMENDGKVSYSPVRFVSVNCGTGISGYPNPAHDYFKVILPQTGNTYNIRVVNGMGQAVLPVMKRGAGMAMLQTDKLAAGMYTVIVTDDSGKMTMLKVIKN